MSSDHLLLILLSACVHVVPHVAIKRTGDRLAFVWWLLLWGSVAFLPLASWRWQAPSAAAWAILLPSAVCETAYFLALTRAYREGDLSLVYPLARGTAPLLLAVWSFVFLAEPTTAGGLLGIGLIALGLYTVNLPRLGAWSAPFRAIANSAAARFALLAGVFTSAYTALDRVGVQRLDPWVYAWLVLSLPVVLLAPILLWSTGTRRLRAEWRVSGRATILAGVTGTLAYSIVLYVMQGGAPAAYVGATREVSVVLATAIGVFWMRERGSALRLVGSVLVVAGVLAIRLLG